MEGDEYDSAFFDKRPKFLHYTPDLMIVNNIEFDHADIYSDLTDIEKAFARAQRLISRKGLVVANADANTPSSHETDARLVRTVPSAMLAAVVSHRVIEPFSPGASVPRSQVTVDPAAMVPPSGQTHTDNLVYRIA